LKTGQYKERLKYTYHIILLENSSKEKLLIFVFSIQKKQIAEEQKYVQKM